MPSNGWLALIIAVIVGVLGLVARARSQGKQAQVADDRLKADKEKIAGMNNQEVADDLTKRAGK